MNILFLTVSRINDLNDTSIYCDLMREFISRGHNVYVVSPTERRFGKKTHVIDSEGGKILKVRTLNIQKTNVLEKGIGTLLLERQFGRAIKKQWPDVRFDLILYSTPPITLNRVIESQKKRTGAPTYLMLKDIFPQNAVDLGMFPEGSLLHRMFRKKEEKLYRISDRIGCMSPANVRYVIDNNPTVDPAKVEICPNSINPCPFEPATDAGRKALHDKFDIPVNKVISVYGGNLGKPQGVDFLLETVVSNERRDNSFFLIVGTGTEFGRLEKWFDEHQPRNARLLAGLLRDEYGSLIRNADIGLIFLDRRFTIPNFPSRLLAYQEAGLPVMVASDPNCDTGSIAEHNKFGLWAPAGDITEFDRKLDSLIADPVLRREMGMRGRVFLEQNYTPRITADIILNSLK